MDQVAVNDGRSSGGQKSTTEEFSPDRRGLHSIAHLIRNSVESIEPRDTMSHCRFEDRQEQGIP